VTIETQRDVCDLKKKLSSVFSGVL